MSPAGAVRSVLPWLRVGWAVVLVVVVGVLAVRSIGESARTRDAVQDAVVQLQMEIRADCAFKWDIAALPRDLHPRGAAVVKLAADARFAYIAKGCQAAGGPPAPPVYTADPTPAPTPGG